MFKQSKMLKKIHLINEFPHELFHVSQPELICRL